MFRFLFFKKVCIQVFATIFINNAIHRKLYYMLCS
ncbi:hypothetical protein T4D_8209 [Trichinella pseudospiralis]|uniref:Uncharacterized protein n=1 Tax=Trichinella pseudospiralis TaxID=6337 RepID=A0A0V1C9J7_TRIPS|nr:hypothetical protein T4D_8209 [Trichinella pseudospiralis]